MIDYINRSALMTIECDTCGKIEEFDGDFKHCIEQAKDNGWSFVKKYNGWHHYCSDNCRDPFPDRPKSIR